MSTESKFNDEDYISPELAAQLANSGGNPDCYEARYVNLKSEAMANYTGPWVPPVRAQKKHHVAAYRPFEGRTTNQDDFGYKGVQQRRKPCILGDNGLGGNSTPFCGDTTQKNDYRAWQVNRAPLAVGPARGIGAGPDDRNFETENARAFTGASYAPRQSRAPQQNRSAPIPFEGVTTNQADFLKWNSRPASLVDRASRYRPRKDDRNFVTEARQEFIEKPFDPNNKSVKQYDPCAPGTNLISFAQ